MCLYPYPNTILLLLSTQCLWARALFSAQLQLYFIRGIMIWSCLSLRTETIVWPLPLAEGHLYFPEGYWIHFGSEGRTRGKDFGVALSLPQSCRCLPFPARQLKRTLTLPHLSCEHLIRSVLISLFCTAQRLCILILIRSQAFTISQQFGVTLLLLVVWYSE